MHRPQWVGAVRQRLLWLRLPMIGLALVLVLRFWNLQIVRGDEFAEIARENYLRDERLRAPRGLIVDRDGRVLADNEPSFALVADSRGLDRLEEIGALHSLEEEERAKLRTDVVRGPTPVRTRMGFDEMVYFEARRRDLSGVRVDFGVARVYPLGPATAHLLGYAAEVTAPQLLLEEFVWASAGDIVGQTGVERQFNSVLAGRDGRRAQIVDSRQRILGADDVRGAAPVRGETLQLNVSAPLHEAAQQAFGDEAGAFVALDVRTGAVLGLGSYPAEDPARFRADPELFRALTRHSRTPLLNRAIQGGFPPGSSFKLISAAAALAEGVVDADRKITCNGRTRVAGRTFRCHRAQGHGAIALREAISKSCNVFFYRIAAEMDVDVLASWARAFGLGERTGLDLRGETAGLIPTTEWKRRVYRERWYPSETASVVVGQGAVSVTPLQMARVAAAIASSGELVTPRLVSTAPSRRMSGIAPEHFALIREGMREAVVSGTAWRVRIPGFEAAGKTGTAQVASATRVAPDNEDRPWEFRTHAWFVGFAPFDDPEIAVAVLVQHGGAGGAAAAPIGREILAAWRAATRSGGGAPVALASAR